MKGKNMKQNSWNLSKLKRQAINNQDFDEYVLNQSGILENEHLKVLDIGCSNGYKTTMLFDKYSNIEHIVGIDIDEKAIDEAIYKFKGNIRYEFKLKSIDDLEDTNKYDIIYLSYVLQHLRNPKEIIKKLKNKLSDRGIIIIKVPDDSFKICYPDEENLLQQILMLYEKEIMPKRNNTKYTDRYIGKKVLNYLETGGYKDIKLYYSINDTINKSKEEKIKFFERSIAFRRANEKDNITLGVKNTMDNLLNKMRNKFEDEKFFYTMAVLYYTATK